MRALLRKELREVLGIAAAALAGYLALLVSLMGGKVFNWVPGMPWGTNEVPFTGSEFSIFFSLVSVVFAVALGFRQSVRESSRGTYLFLLHRPLRRNTIFLVKLATGSALILVCASLPILLYGWWAALPGHHAGPFEWSMTTSAWRFALLMPLLYLGAFLSGLRPARWFGTRLLPLSGAVLALVLLYRVPWWAVGFPLAVLLSGLAAANICFVAQTRDYA
jgi:hypothetical protein